MATRIKRGRGSNLIEDDQLAIGTQLVLPVKDEFSSDEIGSIASGNTDRIKHKGSDNLIREVANLEDIEQRQARKTRLITPDINTTSVYIEETKGGEVEFVVVDRLIYYVGEGFSDGVTFNTVTGVFEFTIPFYTATSKVWAYFKPSLTPPPEPAVSWEDSSAWNDALIWAD